MDSNKKIKLIYSIFKSFGKLDFFASKEIIFVENIIYDNFIIISQKPNKYSIENLIKIEKIIKRIYFYAKKSNLHRIKKNKKKSEEYEKNYIKFIVIMNNIVNDTNIDEKQIKLEKDTFWKNNRLLIDY